MLMYLRLGGISKEVHNYVSACFHTCSFVTAYVLLCEFLVLIILLSNVRGEVTTQKRQCNMVSFGNKSYNRQVLFHGYGKAYSMVMHKNSGYLFFSHVRLSDHLDEREFMACHVVEGSCKSVQGISGGYAVALDEHTKKIFFGGKDGIYQYDFSKEEAKRKGANGLAIYSIAIIKGYFYYVVYPKKRLFIVKNYNFKMPLRVFDTEVEIFLITKTLNVYFSNSTSLYKLETPVTPSKQPVMLLNQVHVRQLVKRFNESVYICAFEGIFENEESNREVKKVWDDDKPFGLAFFESMIMYSDEESIYSLVEDENCLNETIAKKEASQNRLSLRLLTYF